MSNSSNQYVLADEAPVEAAGVEKPNVPGNGGEASTGPIPEEPTVDEVLRVVFDMGVGERETYRALVGRECSEAGEVADELDRERSNVNRYLNALFEKGIVTRRRRILESGGHVYQYAARSPDEVRTLLLAGLSEWAGAARDHIDELVDAGKQTE